MYLNKVFICGNVCNEPELRYTKSNVPVTNFTIKTVDEWINRSNNEQKINTKFHKIVCWGSTAKRAVDIVQEGKMVLIEGELSYHKQEDVTQTEIKAISLHISNESTITNNIDGKELGGK